jgi:5-methylcytosine-specific restriction protein A
METSKEKSGWSDQELEASIDAYLKMLRLEQCGQMFKKSVENQLLREGPLKKRSASSVEYRMQNISAVMEQMDLPRIAGYVSAKNIGTKIGTRIRKILTDRNVEAFRKSTKQTSLTTTFRPIAFELNDPPEGILSPSRISSASTKLARALKIKNWVLEQSRGICEGCNQAAPFLKPDGLPYLEVHHVKHLANHGSDETSNAVALCPNCHRRCHYSNDSKEFTALIYQRVTRLKLK